MCDIYFNNIVISLIFVVGLCMGSFYNVVILRSLSGESIVMPPSKCPKCGEKLKPWHNIPLLSYIFLRGKCAFCNEKISPQYPIIELLTGLFFIWIYMKFGISLQTLFALFWVSCLIIITTTDIKEKIVDCNYAIAIAVSGIILAMVNSGWMGLWKSLLGIAAGVLIIEGIAYLGHIFKKGRAMGQADTYVAAAFGAVAGYTEIVPVLLYSLIASMLFILPIFWYNLYKAGDIKTILFSALFFYGIFFAEIFKNSLWSVIFTAVVGFCLIFFIIKNMRNEEVSVTVPFVPALAAGFMYYVLFVL